MDKIREKLDKLNLQEHSATAYSGRGSGAIHLKNKMKDLVGSVGGVVGGVVGLGGDIVDDTLHLVGDALGIPIDVLNRINPGKKNQKEAPEEPAVAALDVQNLKEDAQKKMDELQKRAEDIRKKLEEEVGNKKDMAEDAAKQLEDALNQIQEQIKEELDEAHKQIKDGINDMTEKGKEIKDKIKDKWNNIWS